jgi:two-component system sensor histidine kinase RpfC
MLFLWMSHVSRPDERDTVVLTSLAVWFAASLGLLLAIWIWPAPSVTRRVLGIVADVGALTFAPFLMGESGVMVVGLYLWLIFSYGFRYGRAYFRVAQIFCLVGFVLVLSMVPWWQHELLVGLSWLMSMIILPSYVMMLVEYLRLELRRAKDALKECVEARTAAAS